MAPTEKKDDYLFIYVFVITLILILIHPTQTKEISSSRGWFTQPYVAPLFGLSILAFFSFIKSVIYLKSTRDFSDFSLDFLMTALSNYRVMLITSVLFYFYVSSISLIGFFFSTLIFVHLLLWLSRLLNPFWSLCTCLTVIGVVLIFRVGVNIWFPDVALYEAFFEGELLWFMNKYF
ncbi:hypothetical protein [Marinomonas sp. PE14-40]|uniref:hypothetical protein n=1 Tax=Marinomonas sp. PE14-40 TaxID=3060621 RepID=UPI003F681D40